MKAKMFQTYICPECGQGVVRFIGYGEDIRKNYYRVFECNNGECGFQEWKGIPFRDFPGDVDPDKMYLMISKFGG
jgi:hypothetical protein